MNITITLTADNNFLTAVNALAAALTGKATSIAPSSPATAPLKEKATKAETPKAEPVKEEAPKAEEITKKVNGKTNGQVTIETIRALVTEKSKEKRGEIKTLLAEFGVPNVSGLQKEQYDDFFTKVEAL